MDAFEELQNNWTDQETTVPNKQAMQQITKGAKRASRAYLGNQLILGVTAIGILIFALYYGGFGDVNTAIGFSLMIGFLLLRIAFEAYHNYKMNLLDFTKQSGALKKDLVPHFKQRTGVHYILTPLCVVGYVIGFVLLLPTFKKALSEGFYTYIIISAAILLILLIILLVYVIKQETRLHRQLQGYFKE